jgi:hypothetical protein
MGVGEHLIRGCGSEGDPAGAAGQAAQVTQLQVVRPAHQRIALWRNPLIKYIYEKTRQLKQIIARLLVGEQYFNIAKTSVPDPDPSINWRKIKINFDD